MQISKPHTSLPKAKQDPAAHVPGTPTLCQYKPKSAPRCRPTPLLPGLRSVVFGRVKGFDYGLSPPGSWPFYRPSPQPKTDRTGAGGAGGERECGSAEFGDSIKKECLNFGVIVLSLMLVSFVREVVCVQHRLSTKQCRDPSPGLGVHFGVYQCLIT